MIGPATLDLPYPGPRRGQPWTAAPFSGIMQGNMKAKRAVKPQPSALTERERVDCIVRAAQELKAEDLVLFDLERQSAITDYVLICSGRSQAHVRGIADRIVEALKAVGVRCASVEGHQEGSWVLLDFDVVLVHVFHPETREYYDLESLLRAFRSERPGDPAPTPAAGPDGLSPSP